MEAITLSESKTLIECEAKIKVGISSFYDVGISLVIIRDQKLYRSTHETFESYCQSVWGWGQKRASQIIIAAEVVQSLPDSTNCRNESQARELARVPAAERPAVLEKAGKNPTAKAIRAAASNPEPEQKREPEPVEEEQPVHIQSYSITPESEFTAIEQEVLELAEMLVKDLANLKNIIRHPDRKPEWFSPLRLDCQVMAGALGKLKDELRK